MTKWLPLLLPAAVFAVLAGILSSFENAAGWVRYPSFLILPYLLMFIGFVLGAVFLQSRVSFMCLFLAVVTFYLDYAHSLGGRQGRCDTIVFLASIYIPVFGVLFYRLGERGLLTVDGYVRFVIVLSGIVVILLVPNIADMSRAVQATGLLFFRPVADWLDIPFAGLLVLLLCLPFFFFRSGFESPLLGPLFAMAIVFAFAGLNLGGAAWVEGARRSVLLAFMSGAGLTFGWAVMESSWRNAHIDELTDLPGRRSFKHHVARLGESYVIAMVDVDHFKKVNDRYGHDTGDQVLRFVASFLKRNAPGKAYRYGGEEFAIICETDDLKGGLSALDELRRSIADRRFFLRGKDRPRKRPESGRAGGGRREAGRSITITVSIGAAQAGKRYGTPQDVIEAADKALYRAKKAGRNQVKSSRS